MSDLEQQLQTERAAREAARRAFEDLLAKTTSEHNSMVEELERLRKLVADLEHQSHFKHYAEVSARAESAEARLSEVTAALDAAGCPTGNEHEVYDHVQRIAGLHKTRDFAWRQMDEMRPEFERLRKESTEHDLVIQRLHDSYRPVEAKLKIAVDANTAIITALKNVADNGADNMEGSGLEEFKMWEHQMVLAVQLLKVCRVGYDPITGKETIS